MSFWQKKSNGIRKLPLWAVGLGLGVLCMVIGFYEEQFQDIYQKAVMICLECIGIG